jgi:hypothetical protein
MKSKNWNELEERLRLYTYEELEKLEILVFTLKKSKWKSHYEEKNKKYVVNKEKRLKNKKRLAEEVYPKILKFAKTMPIGTVYKVGGKFRKLIEIREDYLFGNSGYFYKNIWHNTSFSALNQGCMLQAAYINKKWITKKDILKL